MFETTATSKCLIVHVVSERLISKVVADQRDRICQVTPARCVRCKTQVTGKSGMEREVTQEGGVSQTGKFEFPTMKPYLRQDRIRYNVT